MLRRGSFFCSVAFKRKAPLGGAGLIKGKGTRGAEGESNISLDKLAANYTLVCGLPGIHLSGLFSRMFPPHGLLSNSAKETTTRSQGTPAQAAVAIYFECLDALRLEREKRAQG